jgi:hypothetical protein
MVNIGSTLKCLNLDATVLSAGKLGPRMMSNRAWSNTRCNAHRIMDATMQLTRQRATTERQGLRPAGIVLLVNSFSRTR